MRAEKGNKVYTIDESMKAQYLADGFDIVNDDGNVEAYGKGKMISIEEYMGAVKEIEKLHKRIGELEAELKKAEDELPAVPETNEPSTKKGAKKAGE